MLKAYDQWKAGGAGAKSPKREEGEKAEAANFQRKP